MHHLNYEEKKVLYLLRMHPFDLVYYFTVGSDIFSVIYVARSHLYVGMYSLSSRYILHSLLQLNIALLNIMSAFLEST